MSLDPITEILAAHADQLLRGEAVEPDVLLAQLPARRDELAPLLAVAARVKRTLKPVKPAPGFRARLHDGLIMAAHHQQSQRILIDKRGDPQRAWLIGAAALGSAAGLIAVVWRLRSGRAQAQGELSRVPVRAD